jgi:hypothetical protein
MKLIIAGGRDFVDLSHAIVCINKLIDQGKIQEEGLEIVSGMARGADTVGINIASSNKLPLHEFPANWDKHGKAAGFLRNIDMAKFSDALVAFWDGQSKGTEHMIKTMRSKNKPVYVFRY